MREKIFHDSSVYLDSLTEIPDGVVFNNVGSVDLDNITKLPTGVMFNDIFIVGSADSLTATHNRKLEQ